MRTRLLRLAACAAAATTCVIALADGTLAQADTANLAGFELLVTEQNGACHLASVGARGVKRLHRLDIPGPCSFHKDLSGAVRTIRNGKYDYLLIESSKPAGAGGTDCETQLRSIRASGGRLQVSQHKDKVASCPPFQWDRMVFTELFD